MKVPLNKPNSEPTEGGCFCAAVRYEITGKPVLQIMCFCRDCLVRAGTDGYAGYMVNEDDFKHLKGTTTHITTKADSGRSVDRHFCPICGSHLWGQTQLGLVSVAAGSLDDPTLFKPSQAVFTEQAPPWARIPDLEQPL
jgi:hypothetical protein